MSIDAQMRSRIQAMHGRDRFAALLLLSILWITILFVLTMSWSIIPVTEIRYLVLLGAALVLLFNTASIFAMLKHYQEDMDFIYGLDIQHLDAARAAKRM